MGEGGCSEAGSGEGGSAPHVEIKVCYYKSVFFAVISMKFVAKLKGFKKYKGGLKATLMNKKGDIIIGNPVVENTRFSGNFVIDFKRRELPPKRRDGSWHLKLKVEVVDPEVINYKDDVLCYVHRPKKQRFNFKLNEASKKIKKEFEITAAMRVCIDDDLQYELDSPDLEFPSIDLSGSGIDAIPITYEDPYIGNTDADGYLYNF